MTLLDILLGRELSEKEIQWCKDGHINNSRNLFFERVETQYEIKEDKFQIEFCVLTHASTPDASHPRIIHSGEYPRYFRRRVYTSDGKLMREYVIGGIPGSGEGYSFNRFYNPPGSMRGKIVSDSSIMGEITKL